MEIFQDGLRNQKEEEEDKKIWTKINPGFIFSSKSYL